VIRSKPNSLLSLTQSFFFSYLQSTRGASGHTVRAYRDALKLLFLFLAGQKRKQVADLDLDDLQAEAILVDGPGHFVTRVCMRRLASV